MWDTQNKSWALLDKFIESNSDSARKKRPLLVLYSISRAPWSITSVLFVENGLRKHSRLLITIPMAFLLDPQPGQLVIAVSTFAALDAQEPPSGYPLRRGTAFDCRRAEKRSPISRLHDVRSPHNLQVTGRMPGVCRARTPREPTRPWPPSSPPRSRPEAVSTNVYMSNS